MLRSPRSFLLALAVAAVNPVPADAGCPTCGGGGGGDDSSPLGGGGSGAGSPNSSVVDSAGLYAALPAPVPDSLLYPSPPEPPAPTIVPDDAPPPVNLLLPSLISPARPVDEVFREAKRKELTKTALVQAYLVFSTCSLPPKKPRETAARARPDPGAAIARRPLPKP